MKLTIIGKYGPTPAPFGATSCYLLRCNSASLLLDFGCGVLSKIDSVCKVEEVDAIILSHTHYDHCCDLLPLSYRLKSKPKLYMPPEQENGLAGEIVKTNAYDIVEYSDGESIKIGNCTVTFCKMIHPVPSFAIKVVEDGITFVYTGDTVYNDTLVEFCKGATIVLADALQCEGVKNPHMTVLQAHELQKQINCPVLCTHEPPANCGECEKYPYLRKVKSATEYEII